MNEPLLTDEAREDLAEIWSIIAEARDQRTADDVHRRILEACRLKAEFPETGRIRDDIAPGVRSVVIRPYVAFFRPQGGTILVLRILHGRRDIDRIMEQEHFDP
jgi:toxin ParE1/3/4